MTNLTDLNEEQRFKHLAIIQSQKPGVEGWRGIILGMLTGLCIWAMLFWAAGLFS